MSHLVPGPDRHGVVRFGVELTTALHSLAHPIVLCRSAVLEEDTAVHVQFTDRLFGPSAGAAARLVVDLADRVHRSGSGVTVTLHDVPQPSDGTGYAERAGAYADVCAAVDGVVVCSDHERQLLGESSIGTARLSVIPLPVAAPAGPPTPPPTEPAVVGVFGFLYPGKGHGEVLDAVADLPPSVTVRAIGEPSAGHRDLVDQLTRRARRSRRVFDVTGHVPDSELTATLRSVAVPVAHHRHVSASGSLNAWLSAGRRPLAPRTRYTEELARRNPGALTLYSDDDEGLRSAIVAALAAPESTWLAPGTVCGPTVREAARRYAETLAGWHG